MARFPRVHLYMDGSKALVAGALTVFADRIKAGTAELVSFQHRGDDPGEAPPRLPLDDAWAQWEDRLKERLEELDKGGLTPRDTMDPKLVARAWKIAAKGARSEKGRWAWLQWSASDFYRGPSTLWASWKPGKTLDDGRDLLEHATLQSVDSAFSALRKNARGLRRRGHRAKGGPGYGESYSIPRAIIAEFDIAMFLFNWTRPYKGRTKFRQTPAQAMGITRPQEFVVKPKARSFKDDPVRRYFEVAMGFRLGLSHAARISRWLGR